LPEEWAADQVGRARAGVPQTLEFATRTQIALQQLRVLLAEGAPRCCVPSTIRPNPASTSCPRCPKAPRSPIWSGAPFSDGGSGKWET
jgi:hypothetical protein